MKKFFVGLFSLLMGVGSAFAQTNMSSEMYDLAKMKEGLRNRRVSSYDRTGNNRDHLKAIKPGETAVLADIKGAGVINHIWITMSPGPRQLPVTTSSFGCTGTAATSLLSCPPSVPFSARDGTNSITMLLLPFLPVPTVVRVCAAISPCLLPKVRALR